MNRRHFLLIILLTGVFFDAAAQWTALGGPFGGNVTDLERDGSGNTYAVVSQKVYKSTNNGTNWSLLNITSPAFINDLAYANSKLYAVYYNAFYTSSDGLTWTKTATTFPFVSAAKVLKFGPDGFIAVYGTDGIFVSKDEGATWIKASDSGYVYTSDRVVATSNGDLFALFRTTVLGNNAGFELKKLAYPGVSGTFDPLNWQTKYTTARTGTITTSTASTTVTGVGTSFTTQLTVGSQLRNLAGTSTIGTVASITNNTTLTLISNAQTTLTSAAYTDSNSNTYLMTNGSNVYMFMTADILITQDGGATWPSIRGNTGRTYFWGYGGVNMNVTNGTVYFFNNGYNEIYSITNPTTSNTTWTVLTPASIFVNLSTTPLCFTFISATSLLVGTNSAGVLKSTDTGGSYTQSSNGMNGGQGRSVEMTNSGSKLVYTNATSTRGYWTSVDNGSTWAFVSTGNYYSRVRKLSNGNILLYGSQAVALSTDNLTSLTEISTGTVSATDIAEASDNAQLFAGYSLGSLYTSTNNGANWSVLTTSGWPAGYSVRAVTVDATNVYINASSGSTYKILKVSRAGGAYTDLINYPVTTTSLVNLFMANNKIYAATSSIIYLSADLGATWTSIGFSGTSVFPLSDGTTTAICISKSGSFYVTQDEGNSWNSALLPSSSSYITSITKDPASSVANPIYYASAYLSPALKFTGKLIVDPVTLPPYINFNWQPLNGPFGGAPTDVEIHPDGSLYAVQSGQMYKYSSNVWTKLNPISASLTSVNDLEIDGSGKIYALLSSGSSNTSRVYYSIDGGVSWNARTPGYFFATSYDFGSRLEKMPDNSIVVVTSIGRIFRSTDDGANFGLVATYPGGFFSTTVPILKSSTFIAALETSTAGVVISADNGATWTANGVTGLPQPNGNWIVSNYAVSSTGDLLMTVAESYDAVKKLYYPYELYRSTNQGVSWSKITTPNAGAFSKRIMVMPNGDYILGVNSTFDMYKSTNQGATWTSLPNIGETYAYYEKLGTDVYMKGFVNGILKSSDNGTTLTPLNNGLPRVSGLDIELLDNKDLIVSSGQPLHSSNFGASWSIANNQAAVRFLVKGDSVLSYGGRLILLSTDNGKTWSTIGTDRFFTYITTYDGKNFYAASNSAVVSFGLSTSTDLVNWTPVNVAGLPAPLTYFYQSIAVDKDGIIYAVISDTSTGALSLYKIAAEVAQRVSDIISPVTPRNIIRNKDKIYVYDAIGAIYETSDGGNTWRAISAPAGSLLTISNDYFFITGSNTVLWLSRDFGTSWQSVGENVIVGSNFQDVIINEFDGFAYGLQNNNVVKKSQVVVMVDDHTNPLAASFSPVNNATGVTLPLTFSITFNEAVSSVAGKKLRLWDPSLGSSLEQIDASTGVQDGKKFSFTPSITLSYNKVYYITVDVGAFKDIFGNNYAGFSSPTTWRFTTSSPPDTQAPVITYTTDKINKGSGSKTVSVAITDNIGVATAKISYRSITSNVAVTTSNLVFDGPSSKYQISLPESAFGPMGIELYFTATDAANNSTRDPLTGNYYMYFAFPTGANNLTIPNTLVGQGGDVTGFRIITVPHSLSSNSISTVFDELGPKDNTKWRLVTYKDATSWSEYPDNFSTFTQGIGYFINVKTPPTFVIEGASSPANNKETPFTMNIAPGWNQIGNPYTFPILWSEVKAANPSATTIGTLKVFKGSYADGDKLEVFEGGFVNNTGTAKTITFPITGSLAGGRKEVPSYDISGEEWMVPLTLQVNGFQNSFGGVGMNPKANVGVDVFDDFNPPRFMEYAEINFPHPEHFLRQSTRDVVPTQKEYSWDFSVESSLKGFAELKWDNTVFGTNKNDLLLYDMKRGVLIDMRQENSYGFDPQKSYAFRIYFGEEIKSKIKPQVTTLGDAFPNPSQGNVTIPFTLSEASETYNVTIEVYDITGRKTTTIINGTFKPGFYSAPWEFTESLTNGLYLYRMKVAGDATVEILNGKIILNR